ncbi:DUF3325 family protein [Pigmentiphaga litoralis]|uniref:DUF3325 family protein n=1 Tax=Pigmentiphaga litoralis TaxID=516702 RepID=UPI003B433A93
MTAWLSALALVCSFVAWGAIALTQSAHRELVEGLAQGGCPSRSGSAQSVVRNMRLGIQFLRFGAVLSAFASAAICITQNGWSFGVLMWICLTCLAALLVTLTLTCLRARLPSDRRARTQASPQPHSKAYSKAHSKAYSPARLRSRD